RVGDVLYGTSLYLFPDHSLARLKIKAREEGLENRDKPAPASLDDLRGRYHGISKNTYKLWMQGVNVMAHYFPDNPAPEEGNHPVTIGEHLRFARTKRGLS